MKVGFAISGEGNVRIKSFEGTFKEFQTLIKNYTSLVFIPIQKEKEGKRKLGWFARYTVRE